MIAKHINFKNTAQSDIRRLVDYIVSEKGKMQRIGDVFTTNCHYHEPEFAAREMDITQLCNQRAKGDKTYHLLISFRPGEDPTPQSIRQIEAAVCAKLGFSDHQRVAVVHRDTDNIHVHVAINKIHPRRYSIKTPHNDFQTLARACGELEQKYFLRHDNHEPTGRTPGERAAKDMEAITGQESLLSWIRRECLPGMQQAKTWGELHTELAKSGLTMALRGNGLVIASNSGSRVKGSDVDRAFSKAALEKRFGAFVPRSRSCDSIQPEKTYQKQPLGKPNPLQEEFRKDKDQCYEKKSQKQTVITKQYREQATAIRALYMLERQRIRSLGAGRCAKRQLYRNIRQTLQRDLDALRERTSLSRQALNNSLPGVTWLSWLQEQAERGREEALRILRHRAFQLARAYPSIQGEHEATPILLEKLTVDGITKHGTVIYAVGRDFIRDDGVRLRVNRDTGDDTAALALCIAAERFGEPLTIVGDHAFRSRMLNAAVVGKLNIRFADQQLEAMRQRMMTYNQPIQQHRRENVR